MMLQTTKEFITAQFRWCDTVNWLNHDEGFQNQLWTHRQLISDVFGPHMFISNHTRDLLRLPLQTV